MGPIMDHVWLWVGFGVLVVAVAALSVHDHIKMSRMTPEEREKARTHLEEDLYTW
jgi:hypothetical protein